MPSNVYSIKERRNKDRIERAINQGWHKGANDVVDMIIDSIKEMPHDACLSTGDMLDILEQTKAEIRANGNSHTR